MDPAGHLQLQRHAGPHCLKSGDLVMFGHETIVSVEVLEQTLSDINVETVLRAYLESVCQALEGNAAAAADEMLRTSNEAMDALLALEAGANQSQAAALVT
ncbi:hypothetical protein PLESTF_000713600 [Pleodorina starrii]|nr:hypothetical protein PLESTF_000713600 [Pleodorina starrii]